MSKLKTAAMIPVWVLQVFGMSKSFKTNPILGNRMLNRMGLHVVRIVMAHAMHRVRRIFIAPLVSKEQRSEFNRQGYIIIADYLPQEQFDVLQSEVSTAQGQVRECIQGDTLTHRIFLDEQALTALPQCEKLLNDKKFERLLKYGASHLKRPLYYIQSIKNGFVKGKSDPQKVVHADTFHPTMKTWFFLEDVPLENGPFTYVAGSHRLSWKRLKWEYNRSLNVGNLPDGYSEKGSMRASPQDLTLMGLPQARGLAVKKNTLVVADTHGFHCRGQAKGRISRLELWAYSRTNPFNPLPGFSARWLHRLECKMARFYWDHEDKRAAKRNALSSWHIVANEKMFER